MRIEIESIFTMIQRVKWAAKIKSGRNFNDFFADRILQMASEPTPVAAIERLCASLDADIGAISASALKDFFVVANTPGAAAVLLWIRRHPRVAAMVAQAVPRFPRGPERRQPGPRQRRLP